MQPFFGPKISLLDDAQESKPDRGKSALKLTFVTARPGTVQGRREARAAIRAHASQASWAKIKQEGRQQPETINSIESPKHVRRLRLIQPASDSVSTDLVSASNDNQQYHDSSEGSSVNAHHFVRSRSTDAVLEWMDRPS